MIEKIPKFNSCILKKEFFQNFWTKKLREVPFDPKSFLDCHTGYNSLSTKWNLFPGTVPKYVSLSLPTNDANHKLLKFLAIFLDFQQQQLVAAIAHLTENKFWETYINFNKF